LQEAQDMYNGDKYRDPKWWGTDGFDQDVQTLKQRSRKFVYLELINISVCDLG